jgi:hypothetical protein
MSKTYQFSTTTNWERLYENSYERPPSSNGGKVDGIPNQFIPVNFDNQVLAVWCKSFVAEDKDKQWKYGGQLRQMFVTGLASNTVPDAVASVKKIWLKQISFLFFPKFSTEYSLQLVVPWWIQDLSLIIWGYTGQVNDSIESKLTTIQSDLTTLQHEFDAYHGVF